MKQFTFQGGAQGESVVSATGLTLAVRVAWLARDGQGFPVPAHPLADHRPLPR